MRIRTPADAGIAIRARRHQLGLDQAGLAARVGVSRQWIVAVEGGKPTVELVLLLRTLAALGLTLDVSDGGQPAQPPAPGAAAVIGAAVGGALLGTLLAERRGDGR